MTRRSATLYLFLPCLALLAATPVCGQQPKPDDLAARVQQLEKRIAELEKLLKQTPAKESPKTATETNLVGTWVIAEEERKLEGVFTDLKLKADGTGKAVLNSTDGQWNHLKYDVVGKQLQLVEDRGQISFSLMVRIRSISENELVLECKLGENLRQVHYTREK